MSPSLATKGSKAVNRIEDSRDCKFKYKANIPQKFGWKLSSGSLRHSNPKLGFASRRTSRVQIIIASDNNQEYFFVLYSTG